METIVLLDTWNKIQSSLGGKNFEKKTNRILEIMKSF